MIYSAQASLEDSYEGADSDLGRGRRGVLCRHREFRQHRGVQRSAMCNECLCKLPNITHDFSSVSTIGNLKQTAIPSLFESLVESALMGDFDLEVSVYKVSHEEEDISLYRPPSLEGQAGMGSLQVNSSTPAGVCSLIFHDQCTALEKCRRFCSSVGASRYRWFHTRVVASASGIPASATVSTNPSVEIVDRLRNSSSVL
ncbi:twisted gastrulation [Apostichopus japonicus]|uniref:Twisted gastrulation n=1 Tax=Stichopus japonicus TaxID=307972 RepID=A0A2G8KIC5_STIJA|nr:twisted gastrulation [Apostichopus japonicus]